MDHEDGNGNSRDHNGASDVQTKPVSVWVWVGQDGRQNPQVRFAATGYMPLADVEREKIDRAQYERLLQQEADHTRMSIRLIECVEVNVVRWIHPR